MIRDSPVQYGHVARRLPSYNRYGNDDADNHNQCCYLLMLPLALQITMTAFAATAGGLCLHKHLVLRR